MMHEEYKMNEKMKLKWKKKKKDILKHATKHKVYMSC